MKLALDLENCYGIGKLKGEVNIEMNSVSVIYSSNGTMKTSFVKTLRDIYNGRSPKDQLNANLQAKHIVELNGVPIGEGAIKVFDSYSVGYEPENISDVLISKSLREQYFNLTKTYNLKKDLLIKSLKKYVDDPESIFSEVFLKDTLERNLELAVKEIVSRQYKYKKILDIKGGIIFDKRVIEFFSTEANKVKLEKFAKIQSKFMSRPVVFSKGVFEIPQLFQLKDSLENCNFFEGGHELLLRGCKNNIKSMVEFEDLIDSLIREVHEKPEMKELVSQINNSLDSNKQFREVSKLFNDDPSIVLKYLNMLKFKKEYLCNLVIIHSDGVNEIIQDYAALRKQIEKILVDASSEIDAWEKSIEIFNKRFSAPFKLQISNTKELFTGAKSINLDYRYDGVPVDKKFMVDNILSTSEQRAFYLLNVLFDLNYQRQTNKYKLIVLDDIADSFDYKNKYAILDYLRDYTFSIGCPILILTHNYDFYRSCFKISEKRELMHFTVKDGKTIKIVEGNYLKNIFEYYNKKIETDDKVLISAIPFVRNIHEYLKHDKGNELAYNFYSQILHYRYVNKRITTTRLCRELSSSMQKSISRPNKKVFYDLVIEEANGILNDGRLEQNLERKIILSLGIRYTIENYMFRRLKTINPNFDVYGWEKEAGVLLGELQKVEYYRKDRLELIKRALIYSNDSIHVNAFMIEPLIDFAEENLKSMYKEVTSELKVWN